MSEQILSTIEVLAAKVKAKEEEANELKRIVNRLCAEENLPVRFKNITEASGGSAMVRRDQFYGQTITSAARTYFELRKSANLGAAPVDEIYKAIREGGYKFETKNEENQKIALRNALRKTSSIFHRLPTGDYGLLSWYPGAKAKTGDDEDAEVQSPKRRRKPGKSKTAAAQKDEKKSVNGAPENGPADLVTNDQIRECIFKMEGNYGSADVEKKLKESFPGKGVRTGAISTLLFKLKEDGFIKVISERKGKKGARYSKQ